ncbi:hypothetical protein LEP1GSC172_3070 [Leptospira noguchii]|uniref:Uncharacterized protein n=1 Tax=Leptospira noguchii TaxID=28182 RepID=M6V7J5_9LEPT|nr:hypothetical protein LEP1GSC172_3070 [Leptospira noguchii]
MLLQMDSVSLITLIKPFFQKNFYKSIFILFETGITLAT